VYANMYIHSYVFLVHACAYIIHLSVYVRIGRGDVCVHQLCDGDGSAVCARVGGLVLRARPKPETQNRASPARRRGPRGGSGAQAFRSAWAFNANIGSWNTASVTTLYEVCAASGPAACTMADALGRASVRRVRVFARAWL
jgi:surface protein